MPEYNSPGGHVEEVDSETGLVDGRGDSGAGRREHQTVPIEVPTLTVSLAVELVEGATGDLPLEMPQVSIDASDAEPRPKSGRFLLFLDVELPTSPTTTLISVDGGDRYRDVTREVVVVREGDPPAPPAPEAYPASEPVVTVRLFEEDDTVVQGVVRDGDGHRLGGGRLRITELGFDRTVEIDANGQFVTYFEDVPVDGDLDAVLEIDDLPTPGELSLPVVEGEETTHTLVVNGGAVTLEGGA